MDWQFGALKMFGYDLIVADPPWRFDLFREETGSEKGPAHHYGTMALEDIKALRVGDLAGKDCLLLLWTCGWAMATGQAQDVARAWGFQPKSEIIWNKRTATGKWRLGTGYRVRTMHEPILLCTVGNPIHAAFPSAFDGLAREHSRKPEKFYQLIDKHAPLLKGRADLFSRATRKGWDGWGFEVGKFDAPPKEAGKPSPPPASASRSDRRAA
jgi:N6-adenosine-specific RNA methylase IME4